MICLCVIILITYSFGTEIQLQTDNDSEYFMSDYGDFTYGNKQLLFKLKGKDGGIIWLLSQYGALMDPRYKINIGGSNNTQSILRKRIAGYSFACDIHPGPELNETEFKEYWVSWQNNEIKVGRGAIINSNVFLSYFEDCPFAIKDLRIVARSDITWIFNMATDAITQVGGSSESNMIAHSYKSADSCPPFHMLRFSITRSPIECGMVCTRTTDCYALNYSEESSRCELFTDNAMNGTILSTYFVRIQ